MKPDDIAHLTLFKKLQKMFTDLPYTFKDFIKDLSIGDEGGCNYCFNSNMFDGYFLHKTEAQITLFCKRISDDEYLVTIPIKSNLEDIETTFSMNNL